MRKDEPILARIGRALNERFDRIVDQSLPERWIDRSTD
jgi:hypothetical protein